MKKLPLVINLVTLYLIIYQVMWVTEMNTQIVSVLFLLSPLPVLYMVYVILVHGKPSGETFDDKFYDDWDYRRNGKEEL
jgi:hypothetical protein